MELVYLWVEDYKNIHQQGFNFSPKFECKYDEKTKELTIDEKAHLENFFGKNINVTAIVGENGSGKSSILSSIMTRKKVFLVLFDTELTVYTRNITISTALAQKGLRSSFLSNVLYYSMDNTHLSHRFRSTNHIIFENTNKLITENYEKLNQLNFSLFNFKPYFIYYEFIEDLELISYDYEPEDDLIYSIKSSLEWDYNSDSESIYDAINGIKRIDDEYLNYLLYKFDSLEYLFENINLTEKIHPKEHYLILEKDELKEKLKECDIYFVQEDEFNLLKKYESKQIEINDLEELFGKGYDELLFTNMANEIELNYLTLQGASFNYLSHGEKSLYSFLVNIVNFNKNKFLLFLDEPDNTLHPYWQKNFLNELIQVFKALNKKVHIVITTHSPFLLSDLPKQNTIFLEKDPYTEDCINSTDTVNINPFGANIHTLLSHGFFMQDGLMGEFAKGKINDVINFLNNKESTIKDNDEAQKLLYIIGEPIIRNKLQKMLDSKRLSKADEIDDIKIQIEKLTQRLDEIEDD